MPFIRFNNSSNNTAADAVDTPSLTPVDILREKYIGFKSAPIFLIPGIHGNYHELKLLATELNLNGFQRIHLYDYPKDESADQTIETFDKHAKRIAQEIVKLHKKSHTLLPPIVIGFSYGAALASYAVNAISPALGSHLIILDGATHAILKQYYESACDDHIDELLLILNTAAISAGLKALAEIPVDTRRKSKNLVHSADIANSLLNLILQLNSELPPESKSKKAFAQSTQIILRNLNTISRHQPFPLSIPYIYTLFTEKTLNKTNSGPFGGFEALTENITDLSTDAIASLDHLALIKPNGASLIADIIYTELKKDLDTKLQRQDRFTQWNEILAVSNKNYSSSSDEDEEDYTDVSGTSPPVQSTLPPTTTQDLSAPADGREPKQPASPGKTSRKRNDNNGRRQTMRFSNPPTPEYKSAKSSRDDSSDVEGCASSASASEEERQLSTPAVISSNPSTLFAVTTPVTIPGPNSITTKTAMLLT